MSGLFRNNFYSSIPTAKFLAGAMLLSGVFIIILDKDAPALLTGYMLFGMVGFSISAFSGLQRENTAKWRKYKLAAPVRRKEIIRSYFVCQLLWLSAGMLLAFTVMGLSMLLHGFPFDRRTDILMVFVAGMSISMFMGAFYFPLFYLGGSERSEVTFAVSLLCAVGLMQGIISLLNIWLGPELTAMQVIAGAAVLAGCAAVLFGASYFLTVAVFKKKEY